MIPNERLSLLFSGAIGHGHRFFVDGQTDLPTFRLGLAHAKRPLKPFVNP